MRAARLLKILLLLQNRGQLTSRFLAEELEVTPRTIWRDIDALTEAGIPVIANRGNTGGITLAFNYRTQLTLLNSDETTALALMLGTTNRQIGALGLDSAFESLKLKLVESLPEETRSRIVKFAQHMQLHETPSSKPDARLQGLLFAIENNRQITARYDRDGVRSAVTFRPVKIEIGARKSLVHVEIGGQKSTLHINYLTECVISNLI